jgi:hypothetical protein
MDSVMGLAFAQEDAEGLIREITLLEGELAGRVRTKKRPRWSDGAWRLVDFEMEHWEEFEELSLPLA